MIPILAVIPLLGTTANVDLAATGFDLIGPLEAVGVIVLIVVGGCYALRPDFGDVFGRLGRGLVSLGADWVRIDHYHHNQRACEQALECY